MTQAALALPLRPVELSPPNIPSAGSPPPRPAAATPGLRRRRRLWVSFAFCVLLPAALSAVYLWAWAEDQFHSRLAFSVRSEAGVLPIEPGILAAVGGIGGGAARDAEVLFDFIGSEDMVAAAERELDLRRMFRPVATDPVFALPAEATQEDLVDFWRRMVRVRLNSGTGLLDVEVRAFQPGDAQAIGGVILAESEALVNRLSDEAQRDAIRYAAADLAEAETRLRKTRRDLAAFRDQNRMVDPAADLAGQMGLLNALQAEQVQAQVERDMLMTYASADDQRVAKIDRRLDALAARITVEREKLGLTGDTGAMAALVGRYEELRTDLEFAAGAYTQALAGQATATAEARRKSRYLAAHIRPTLAETPLYPRRLSLSVLMAAALFLAWGIGVVFCYTLRDSR